MITRSRHRQRIALINRQDELRYVSDAAHERSSTDRGAYRQQHGAAGRGETGTSAIFPAIANAIFAATGKRLRKMPVDAGLLKEA
jgi:hypothetical protein